MKRRRKKHGRKMLIACKCLNITLKSTANNLPSTLPIATQLSNFDEISYKTTTTSTSAPNANQVHTVSSSSSATSSSDENHDDQPPYIQCNSAEKLNSNQLQFFRTVSVDEFIRCIFNKQKKRVIWMGLRRNVGGHRRCFFANFLAGDTSVTHCICVCLCLIIRN